MESLGLVQDLAERHRDEMQVRKDLCCGSPNRCSHAERCRDCLRPPASQNIGRSSSRCPIAAWYARYRTEQLMVAELRSPSESRLAHERTCAGATLRADSAGSAGVINSAGGPLVCVAERSRV